jgi:TRAP-type mannitol/chloroaromatic compound transport system permease large subunit
MGAVGALMLALLRRRIGMDLLSQALNSTAKLSCFVLFVLIGSTIFSLTFQAIDGPIWVEHLFDRLPGGQLGFLVFVNLLIFFLGFFIDFFEIAFILLPLLAPVASKLEIDLVWFGVIVAMNLQTSFLTPPFGFALFYLRSVAPAADYEDRVTGRPIARMTTGDIYRGSVPFVVLQLVMLVAVIAFPSLSLDALGPKKELDVQNIRLEVQEDPAAPDKAGSEEPGAADNPFRIRETAEPDANQDIGAALMKDGGPAKDGTPAPAPDTGTQPGNR